VIKAEFSASLHSKKILGCFNPTLGQTWTNPAIGLHFYPNFWVCPYLTQNRVKQLSIFFYSLLYSSVSHDPSEIILICYSSDQETLLSVVLLNMDMKNCFSGFYKLKI